MADTITDAVVAFAEAVKDDPNGSDVSRAAAHQLVDALTTPPADAGGDAAPAEPAPAEPAASAG